MKAQSSFTVISLVLALVLLLLLFNPIGKIREISGSGRDAMGLTSAERYFGEGWDLYENGEYGDAIERFRKVEEQKKAKDNHSQARFNRILCRLAMKDFRNAEQGLRDLRESEELTRPQDDVIARMISELESSSGDPEGWSCCDFAGFGNHWAYGVCINELSDQGRCPHKPIDAYDEWEEDTGQSEGGSSPDVSDGTQGSAWEVTDTEDLGKRMTLSKDSEEVMVFRADNDADIFFEEREDGSLDPGVMFMGSGDGIEAHDAIKTIDQIVSFIDTDADSYEEKSVSARNMPEEGPIFSLYKVDGTWMVFDDREVYDIDKITRFSDAEDVCYRFTRDIWVPFADSHYTICD